MVWAMIVFEAFLCASQKMKYFYVDFGHIGWDTRARKEEDDDELAITL
jgi:hypothetical protein